MRKPYMWRGAKLAVTAAVALAMAFAMMASPANAAESDQVPISFERLAAAPAQAQVPAQQQALIIQVANGTGVTFDELVLFFNRFSNPLSQSESRLAVAPGQSVVFTLDGCGDINQYAIGVFVNGELVLNTGNIVPDRVGCFENVGIV